MLDVLDKWNYTVVVTVVMNHIAKNPPKKQNDLTFKRSLLNVLNPDSWDTN